MTEQHPITPPPELVQQWRKSGPADAAVNNAYEQHIATQAARWGADEELEACVEWLITKEWIHSEFSDELCAARRPKSPSLKEQALQELERVVTLLMPVTGPNKVKRFAIIRRALEQLDD